MGFNKPSKIQETALPNLISNPPINLIAQSQSGTGKTAAFVLAMLTRVDPAKRYPQILCLSPTYDLAKQTGEVTPLFPLNSYVRYRGTFLFRLLYNHDPSRSDIISV